MLIIGRKRDAGQRRQPKRKKTVPKDDDHRNWPWHAQRAVQANHCGFHHADTAQDNGKLSQKLWDTVAGHKNRNVHAVAGGQKEEGQRQHVEAGIEQRPQDGTMPATLQQRVPSFEQAADGRFGCRTVLRP